VKSTMLPSRFRIRVMTREFMLLAPFPLDP